MTFNIFYHIFGTTFRLLYHIFGTTFNVFFTLRPTLTSTSNLLQPSTFQSPIVRRSGSKFIPTFTMGRPERANFEA